MSERKRDENMKRMKISPFLLIFFFTVFAATAVSVSVFSTPPISLKLSYNDAAKVLNVTVTHPTLFPSSHYIAFIDIKNRGRTVQSITCTSQPTKTAFTYSFPVAACEGDIIEVTATCSFFGSKTSSLTILPSPITTK